MPIITPGNMFSRGQWEFCAEYDPGDVVARAGSFWLCIRQNAGNDPLSPLSENYWAGFGGGGGGEGMPPGGLAGQTLGKETDADYDTSWQWPQGDKLYRGYFKTPAQLIAKHPIDEPGAFASVMSTFTVWLWNDEGQMWDDSGKSGVYVQTVNGKIGPDVLLTADDIPGVEKLANKNKANGYAGLDGEGLLPVERLPMKGGKKDQVWGKKSDADNDMGWVDQKGGGGGGGEHNGLDGLQGGRPESAPGTDDAERYHLTKKASEAAEDLADKRPQKPVNLSPEDGETDILEEMTFVTSSYFNAYSLPMYGVRFRLYDEDETIVFDSGVVPSNVAEYRIAAEILQAGARVYKWDMAHIGSNMVSSLFSDKTTFSTPQVWPEQYIDRPAMIIPADGQILNSNLATLMLSAFSGHGGAVQGPSNFRIATDPQMQNLLESGSAEGNYFRGAVALPRGQRLYADGQQTSEIPTPNVKSFRSFPVFFTVREYYRKQRIGVALIDEDSWALQRIDENYLPVDIDGDYWKENILWAAWEESLRRNELGVPQYMDVYGQKMFSHLLHWMQSGRLQYGPLKGKKFWMIDPTTPSQSDQIDGWHPHALFVHPDGGYQDSVYIGGYLSSIVSGKAVSNGGTAGYATAANWLTYANANNTDTTNPATRNWKLGPYYLYQDIAVLFAIEFADFLQARTMAAQGYRGFKGFVYGQTSSSTSYPYGLLNGSAIMPGYKSAINLPRYLLYTEGITNTNAYSYIKPTGFWGKEDGVNEALYFDDYMILKGGNEVTTAGTGYYTQPPYGDIFVGFNGSYNTDPALLIGMCRDGGTNISSPLCYGVSEANRMINMQSMLVKYN